MSQNSITFQEIWRGWRRVPWTKMQVSLIVALIAVQISDLLTFFPAIAVQTLAGEQNPLARAIYSSSGPLGLALMKAIAMVIVLLFLYSGMIPRVKAWNVFLVGVICLCAIGPLSNTVAALDSGSGNGGPVTVAAVETPQDQSGESAQVDHCGAGDQQKDILNLCSIASTQVDHCGGEPEQKSIFNFCSGSSTPTDSCGTGDRSKSIFNFCSGGCPPILDMLRGDGCESVPQTPDLLRPDRWALGRSDLGRDMRFVETAVGRA